jgi:hypothetical protein
VHPGHTLQALRRRRRRRRDIMVALINLNIDPQVKASLKDLEAHHSNGPWIRKIKENLTNTAWCNAGP